MIVGRQQAPNRFYPRVSLTRAGVVPFRGEELRDHRGVDPRRWYFVLRSPDVLRKALDGFNGCPLLNTHRRTLGLDAARWRGNIVGATGTKAQLDDDGFVRNALTLWSLEAIDAGRQLSVGFRSQIEIVHGHDHDAVVRDCRVDHVAIVERGKAGADCALEGDSGEWQRLADALARW